MIFGIGQVGKKCLNLLFCLLQTNRQVCGNYHFDCLIFMKQILSIVIMILFLNISSAQEINIEIPTQYMVASGQMGRIDSPAYLDSTLFARYLNWNLQPDSLPTNGNPAKGDTIEIRYIVSNEGKI